jgi:predicted dehydrogenase
MKKTPLAIVGFGKIARDQHVAAIAGSSAFELVAIASPHSRLEGVPWFKDLDALIASSIKVGAVALCTTPQVRFDAARRALEQGLHVLLEKPPGVTVSEVLALVDIAKRSGSVLAASWHSRHARGVEPARAWLSGRAIRRVTITWKEDVRVWHPGQAWIWKAGGLGVFDPGINALSILTEILPAVPALLKARLFYPENCETPIAADLDLAGPGAAPIAANFDFRQTGPQTWDIEVETDRGTLVLSRGGSVLKTDGREVETPDNGGEYPDVYARFANVVANARIDVDLAPLQLVADAFLCGERVVVEPFIE